MNKQLSKEFTTGFQLKDWIMVQIEIDTKNKVQHKRQVKQTITKSSNIQKH